MYLNINARFLTQSVTGVQRYAIQVVRAWNRMAEAGVTDTAFSLVGPRNAGDHLRLSHVPLRTVGRLRGHPWEQIELPLSATGDLLVSLCNAAPALKRRQVVTIHDAAVYAAPETYPFAYRAWYRALHRALGRTASVIVTDSEFSKSELIRYCGMRESNVRVVYLGGEHMRDLEADESILDRHNLREEPFVLGVSSLNPNKNFGALASALEILGDTGFNVAIAGGVNPRVFSRTALDERRGIKHLGYVTDPELRALYEHAACFVYPSFYEGFGLPPLEAMNCGCPVIVSRAASLPEVCGDAALYCDPHSPEDIAANIRVLMEDESLRADMRERGLARAGCFSWDGTARQLLSICEDLLRE